MCNLVGNSASRESLQLGRIAQNLVGYRTQPFVPFCAKLGGPYRRLERQQRSVTRRPPMPGSWKSSLPCCPSCEAASNKVFTTKKGNICVTINKDGDTLIVLFGGGTKRGQQRDIDRAKELLAENRARKKAMTAKSTSKHKG
jgi:hypothetical protein